MHFAGRIHYSFINTCVREHQKKLKDGFEYKRQTLILDATDHRLVQYFINFRPNKSQVGIGSIISFSIFFRILIFDRLLHQGTFEKLRQRK
jgi:hypothetical protein